jgi:glycerophosphoryl diester phosphodiesterase
VAALRGGTARRHCAAALRGGTARRHCSTALLRRGGVRRATIGSVKPLRIGHRGAAGYAPENTLLSVQTALSLGVDVIEIDIHRSRDGHLIVMHDERVDRTTNGSGYIRDLTLSEIRAFGTSSGLAVPILAEVIDFIQGKSGLMIDVKARGLAPDLLAVAGGADRPVYYASFFHSELLEIRRLQPDAKTIALIDAVPVSLTGFAGEAEANIAGIGLHSLVPEFVESLHDAGLGVFAYTVNEPRDISRVSALGVDGIVSDFPDRLP